MSVPSPAGWSGSAGLTPTDCKPPAAIGGKIRHRPPGPAPAVPKNRSAETPRFPAAGRRPAPLPPPAAAGRRRPPGPATGSSGGTGLSAGPLPFESPPAPHQCPGSGGGAPAGAAAARPGAGAAPGRCRFSPAGPASRFSAAPGLQWTLPAPGTAGPIPPGPGGRTPLPGAAAPAAGPAAPARPTDSETAPAVVPQRLPATAGTAVRCRPGLPAFSPAARPAVRGADSPEWSAAWLQCRAFLGYHRYFP